MKVLLFDDTPAYLCHGGKQVHAEQLRASLQRIGVDAEYARWWDPGQTCDVLHMLGCQPSMVHMAHEAGVKVVLTHIVDHMTNSSSFVRHFHQARNAVLRRALPRVAGLFPWSALRSIDALAYMHRADAETAVHLYGVSRARTFVIPHGCSREHLDAFDRSPPRHASYLVSLGSIVPRKNSVALARAARRAHVPIVFAGKPFAETDPYFKEFISLVDGRYVVYRGFVSEHDKTQLLAEASGFVLLSSAESGCIAVYEAAAAHLPMLLPDLPWARAYGSHRHLRLVRSRREREVAAQLASFFRDSRRLTTVTFPVLTWDQVADAYRRVYERVLR
jgi:glycosyltransferase involved in cell wall biosynthesis